MQNTNVCIIGAGIAGLAAARKLKAGGCKVTVLEAKDYIGGRIKMNYSLGIPFPMGAAFVHDDKDGFICQLIEKYKPKLYDFSKAPSTIFDENKNAYTTAQLTKAKDSFDRILKKSKQLMRMKRKDISLLESITHILKEEKYPISEAELQWELLYLSLFTGIEAKFLSAKHWDQMGDFNSDYLLLTSYEPLITDLAKDQNIHLNTIVRGIEYRSNVVKLETNQGIFEADKVIITVPLGVLQSNQILFSPMLPEIKLSAIQHLKMSQLTKIGLLFPYQFWPNDVVILGYNSNSRTDVPLFFNYSYFFQKPILLAAISGEMAVQLEKAGKKSLVDQAMSTLRQLFGNDIPDPVTSIATNWITDPFTQGSYSYIPIGASGNDFDILAESADEKLFFAGEATYRNYHSTVQGAYLSGVREADKILSIF